jgi:hypothetical protein
MTKTYYVGLDVHKETIAIAYAAGVAREKNYKRQRSSEYSCSREIALESSP